MKNILLILILLTNYSYGQKNFEGIITFNTEISTSELAKDSLQEILEYNYGKSLKVFYKKNGNFIRKYLKTGEYGNDYQIYFNDTGELLITQKGSNKIDTLDVKINKLELIDKSVIKNKVRILNSKCDCIIYNAISENKESVTLEFCYSSDLLKIDPKGFQKHNDFFLSDYFTFSKSPYLKYRLKTKEFELNFTATEIIEKEITQQDIRGK